MSCTSISIAISSSFDTCGVYLMAGEERAKPVHSCLWAGEAFVNGHPRPFFSTCIRTRGNAKWVHYSKRGNLNVSPFLTSFSVSSSSNRASASAAGPFFFPFFPFFLIRGGGCIKLTNSSSSSVAPSFCPCFTGGATAAACTSSPIKDNDGTGIHKHELPWLIDASKDALLYCKMSTE